MVWLLALLLMAVSPPEALDTDAPVPSESEVADTGEGEASQFAAFPLGDEDAGYEIYAESCRACHSGVIAPSLKGSFDRPVAAVEGYSYSEGLAARSGETWTEANLHAFLADPEAFAEGSKMKKKVTEPQDRADLIAFLMALPG